MTRTRKHISLLAFSLALVFGICASSFEQSYASVDEGLPAYATETANHAAFVSTQAQASVDEVEEMIKALPADPTEYKASDAERVFAVEAAFNALSEEDRATLDSKTSHPDSGQPLGRVLEIAVWSVKSYDEVDNSTTLGNGTYSGDTVPTLLSIYSKGKSTSGRDRPWHVKSVTVENGKAYATIEVESSTYPQIWKAGVYYPRTNSSGNCEFSGVPIDLNTTFYFAGVSSSMPTPIAFSLTTTIDESASSDGPIGETALAKAKRLIAALPADPDAVTEADRSAIEAATAAYMALTVDEQKLLDSTEFGKDSSYGRWLEVAQWGLLALQPVDNSLAVIDGDYSAYVKSSSSMGKSKSARARTWSVVKLAVSGGRATALVRCGQGSAFVKMRVGGIDYNANVVDGVPEFTVPIKVNGTTTFTVDANAVSDSVPYQIQVTLPLEQAAITAATAAASKAATALGSDWSAYEDASVFAVMLAANALATAAVKLGVTTVELNVATAALDSTIAGAVKKAVPQTDTTDQTTSKTKKKTTTKTKKKTNTLTSATSKVTGTSRSQVVPTVSSGNGSGTTSRGLDDDDEDDEGDDDDEEDEDEPSSTSDGMGEANQTEETIAKSSTTGGEPSATPSASIREVSVDGDTKDATIPLVFVGGAAIAFVLAGMVVRTLLFARAKDVE